MRSQLPLLLALGSMLLAACTPDSPGDATEDPVSEAEHLADVEAWSADRDERLRRPDGWLSLAGLYWLEEGESTIGAAPTNDLVVPAEKAPPSLGVLNRRGGSVTFRPAGGAIVTVDGERVAGELPLVPDAGGGPTLLEHDSLSFHLIERADRVGVRLRDSNSEVLAAFTGMEYFPVDPSWRVIARFEPYDPPKTLQVPNIIGIVEELPAPGALVFEVDGQEYRLEPTQEGDRLFVVFGDTTNGRETYGGGRYIYTDLADARGRVVLDFNKAYNPPCVFTPYATCPLPTPENRLPIPVRVGEKAYYGAYAS